MGSSSQQHLLIIAGCGAHRHAAVQGLLSLLKQIALCSSTFRSAVLVLQPQPCSKGTIGTSLVPALASTIGHHATGMHVQVRGACGSGLPSRRS